jgi:RNA polymerase sigma factor FliA
LIEHLPQVRYIAKRIHDRLPQHVPLEDLINSGVLGLIEALHKYDPSKHVQLKSYAKVRIRGAILDSLRELDWSPRTLRKRARQIEYASQALRIRFARAPLDTEVAAELGMSLNKFHRLLGDLHGLEVVSLQALSSDDGYGDDGSRYLAHTTAEDPVSLCLRAEMNRFLARAIRELAPRKREILVLYYFKELSMKEVGARLGVGESRVSQIHTATLGRLRVRMRQLLASRARQKPTRNLESRAPSRANGSRTRVEPALDIPAGIPENGCRAKRHPASLPALSRSHRDGMQISRPDQAVAELVGQGA